MSNPWQIQTLQCDRTNADGNDDLSGYGQISVLLSHYVRKEKGKGLSSNDFTNTDVLKLNSIEVGAQVNKLETLTINGCAKIYPDDDRNINLNIPTKVSELSNDEGYAKMTTYSEFEDYSDSCVGKSRFAFQNEEDLAIGKDSIACCCGIAIGLNSCTNGGIAIGVNTSAVGMYDVNINDELKHNVNTDLWEGKTTATVLADVAIKNENNTDLTQLDVVICDLADEIVNRCNADDVLQCNIDTEATTRCDADNVLQCNINAEATARCNADDALSCRTTAIEELIPNQASCSNQLADKSFVNSTIQTNTANFRGNWSNWSDVPTDSSLYPRDYAGSTTPTVNDYMAIQDASDYTLRTLSGTWRFKYTGTWSTNGKSGWIPEYQVNEEPFTSEQLYAINSGITCNKVNSYDNHLSNRNNPHSVTATQVGLGNVCNTADSDRPVLNGTTKFTTGGAYTELNKKQDKNLSTSITIDGNPQCNVECILNSLNTFTSNVWNNFSCHACDTCNPHCVTATQVGLGNVCNIGTDTCVTQGSTNNVTSGAVYEAISHMGTINMCDTCENCNVPLALCTDVNSVGKSACCSLTYNPTTGLLCANCFCGAFDGSITNAICSECVCIQSTSSDVNYDVGLLAIGTGLDGATVCFASSHSITYNPHSCILNVPYFCGGIHGIIDNINNFAKNYMDAYSCCSFAENYICTSSCCSFAENYIHASSCCSSAKNCIIANNSNHNDVQNVLCASGCESGEVRNILCAIANNPHAYNILIACDACNNKCFEINQCYDSLWFKYNDENGTCEHYICYDGTTDLIPNVSLKVYCGSTCKCTVNNNGSICLGSNAFNSTTIPTKTSQLTNDCNFTSNTGTVTSITICCNGTSLGTATTSKTFNICDSKVLHTQLCSSVDRNILFASGDIATGCYCGVYFSNGTNGCPFTYNACIGELKVPKVTIGKGCATMQYNSTTQAIEFTFA